MPSSVAKISAFIVPVHRCEGFLGFETFFKPYRNYSGRHKGAKAQRHKENMNLYYLNRDEFDKLYELSREIERMLRSLIRKLSSK